MNKASRYRLEAASAAFVTALVRPLPRRLVLYLGRVMGRVWAALDGRHRRIAIDNLRRSFPDWDAGRLDLVARGVYRHFAATLLDLLWMQGRSAPELLSLADIEGIENARAAAARGKGVIYCTAHIGNWELHGLVHGPRIGSLSVVARPLDNSALDRRLIELRAITGNSVVYKRKALATVLRVLRAGHGIALLLDQNVQAQDGIFIDFFGRKAATTTVAAALALKTGCAIVPTWTELRPDGRYLLRYEPELPVRTGAERDAEIVRITQAIASRTEEWIRQKPEQWLWMHRRWKTEAPGAQPSAVRTEGARR